MKRRGRVRFRAPSLAALRLDLITHMPDLGARPLGLELFLNGERLCALSIFRHGWLSLRVEVPDDGRADDEYELELRADRTWQPRPDDPENRDDRELSVAVCNIEAFP